MGGLVLQWPETGDTYASAALVTSIHCQSFAAIVTTLQVGVRSGRANRFEAREPGPAHLTRQRIGHECARAIQLLGVRGRPITETERPLGIHSFANESRPDMSAARDPGLNVLSGACSRGPLLQPSKMRRLGSGLPRSQVAGSEGEAAEKSPLARPSGRKTRREAARSARSASASGCPRVGSPGRAMQTQVSACLLRPTVPRWRLSELVSGDIKA